MLANSIHKRLLISGGILLFAFIALTAWVLDKAFRHSSETALNAQLQTHVYTLLATAKEDDKGRMRLPTLLSAPGFNQPDSGIYAEVVGEKETYIWRSASLVGRDFSYAPGISSGVSPGETRFSSTQSLQIIEQGIIWEDLELTPHEYHLVVAMDKAPLVAEQRSFRQTLWLWLGGLGLLLLTVQLALTHWGLSPLQRLSEGIRSIEQGKTNQLQGPVPKELNSLVDAINSLISQSRQRQERIRNSLADLAHSLKTPLAVLLASRHESDLDILYKTIEEQTKRIDSAVTYQRQRAAVAGGTQLQSPTKLSPVIKRISNGLQKVHHDKRIRCQQLVTPNLQYRADEGDLFELFGNLIENAFKQCVDQVRIEVKETDRQLRITIEDDGPGIEKEDRDRLLQRGERADQLHPGQGIGLAVVHEIVKQYQGNLKISESPLGGACLEVQLPLTNSHNHE